ncbi:alpha/beta fold hydrolase [Thermocatellispora tengchongensis]|uniref:alpha/beta fold hydrolase n=1 Tax=Thermocatellispora tengchongensis TaxID=1073253 RepID=UPI003634E26F
MTATPTEKYARIRGRRLAYLDFGGDGTPILALHGHFGRARMFAPSPPHSPPAAA